MRRQKILKNAEVTLSLHTSLGLCLSMASKAERWAARAQAAHAGPAPPAPEEPERDAAAEAASASACASKAAGSAQAPAGVQKPAASQANQTPAFMQLVRQDRLEWPAPCQPVPGSAMEAWMLRAEAKQLHLTWREKITDYADEVHLSVKVSVAAGF
jgi:hypothetical protein